MLNINPTMRPFVAAIAPPAPVDPVLDANKEHWDAVYLSEAQDNRLLRALRDQQQVEQSQGRLS